VLSALPAVIPSPTEGVWHLGPVPLRAYALCILLGIVVCIWWSEKRWGARGGPAGTILDVAAYAVPAGIVGGRLYHVITSPQAYFGENGDPVSALYIWEGGLGIWGAVVLGGVGAWFGCVRSGVKLPPLADSIAPGLLVAQAIGRLGNWFNNELYGRETDLPWALRIYDWDTGAGAAERDPVTGDAIVLGTYHPAFLYELLWNLGAAAVLVWADRRWKLGHGRVFALYVALYTLGRAWIEALRIDPANHILGLRLNLWTSALLFVGAVVYLVVSARRRPGRETDVRRGTPAPGDGDDDDVRDVDDVTADADPGTTPEVAPTAPAGAQQDAEHPETRGSAPAG
jgi:prolipoprotein diacylglyceryl transferase